MGAYFASILERGKMERSLTQMTVDELVMVLLHKSGWTAVVTDDKNRRSYLEWQLASRGSDEGYNSRAADELRDRKAVEALPDLLEAADYHERNRLPPLQKLLGWKVSVHALRAVAAIGKERWQDVPAPVQHAIVTQLRLTLRSDPESYVRGVAAEALRELGLPESPEKGNWLIG
jgi:hypothetical protein